MRLGGWGVILISSLIAVAYVGGVERPHCAGAHGAAARGALGMPPPAGEALFASTSALNLSRWRERRGGNAAARTAMTHEAVLALCLALPAAGAALIAACHRRPNLREAVSLVTAAALFLGVLSLSEAVLQGERPALVLGEIIPGLAIALELERSGALRLSARCVRERVYSIGYCGNDELHQTRFFVCFALPRAAIGGPRRPCSRCTSSQA